MNALFNILKVSTAFIYNVISIIFTFIAWILLGIGTCFTIGANGLLDLMNNLGTKIYANQINGTNTNRPQGTK